MLTPSLPHFRLIPNTSASLFFLSPPSRGLVYLSAGGWCVLLVAVQRGSSPKLVRLSNHVRSTQDMVPVPRVRRVLPEHEGKYKVSLPKGLTARSRRLLAKQQRTGEWRVCFSTMSLILS